MYIDIVGQVGADEAKRTKSALITNVNNPSVSKLIGSVSKTRIGFKVMLINPKNKASHKAVQKLVTVTPVMT
jgi:hypothetical protein